MNKTPFFNNLKLTKKEISIESSNQSSSKQQQGQQRPQKLNFLNHLKCHPLPTDTSRFNSFNPQKWLPYQILGGKTVENVQIDPQHGGMAEKAKRPVSKRVSL